MNKPLITLASAVLLLAAGGCSAETTQQAAAPSPTQSSSAPATASASPAPTPTASPVSLAEGFPAALLPVLDGAEIRSSTVDRDGEFVTAVLVQSAGASTEDIMAFYQDKLGAKGFTAVDPKSVPSRDFIRTAGAEPETVNVTVIARDREPATVTVGATILTETAGQP